MMIAFLVESLIAILLGATVGTLVFTWRNHRVMAYRVWLITRIMRAAHLDRLDGRDDFLWRIEALDAVTYDRMMWQFWRPLARFYPDRRFLEPRGRDERHDTPAVPD